MYFLLFFIIKISNFHHLFLNIINKPDQKIKEYLLKKVSFIKYFYTTKNLHKGKGKYNISL